MKTSSESRCSRAASPRMRRSWRALFEIPTVVGVEHLMESVGEGDTLVIDGNSGIVYVNPSSPDVEHEYQR